MALTLTQFTHLGLRTVYFGGSSGSIPKSLEGRCRRLLDCIDAATKPEDTDIRGYGYKSTGLVHSLDVNGTYRISFHWSGGKPANIDYA